MSAAVKGILFKNKFIAKFCFDYRKQTPINFANKTDINLSFNHVIKHKTLSNNCQYFQSVLWQNVKIFTCSTLSPGKSVQVAVEGTEEVGPPKDLLSTCPRKSFFIANVTYQGGQVGKLRSICNRNRSCQICIDTQGLLRRMFRFYLNIIFNEKIKLMPKIIDWELESISYRTSSEAICSVIMTVTYTIVQDAKTSLASISNCSFCEKEEGFL